MNILSRIKRLEEHTTGGIVGYSFSECDKLKPCISVANDKVYNLTIEEYKKDIEVKKANKWVIIDLFKIHLMIEEGVCQ